MDSLTIAKEDLSLYLPRNVIQDVLELSHSSPVGMKNPLTQLESPNTSPQIPPLESRLHSYLLRENTRIQPQCQLNLADIFDSLKVQEEIEKEIQNMNKQGVSLFSAMQEDKIFEEAEREIKEYLMANKENMDPRVARKHIINGQEWR